MDLLRLYILNIEKTPTIPIIPTNKIYIEVSLLFNVFKTISPHKIITNLSINSTKSKSNFNINIKQREREALL